MQQEQSRDLLRCETCRHLRDKLQFDGVCTRLTVREDQRTSRLWLNPRLNNPAGLTVPRSFGCVLWQARE